MSFNVTANGGSGFGITLSGAVPNEGSGVISGAGTLPSQGFASHYGSGSCSATGTLPAEGRASHYGSGSCSATGTLPGEGQAPAVAPNEGSGVVSGTGTLPAQGFAAHYGSGTCAGTGTLPGEGQAPVVGAAEGSGVITGSGTLSAQGFASHYGSGSCSGTGALPGEGEAPITGVAEGSGSITGAGTLRGEGYSTAEGSGSIDGAGSLPGQGLNGETVVAPPRSYGGGRVIGYIAPDKPKKKRKEPKTEEKAPEEPYQVTPFGSLLEFPNKDPAVRVRTAATALKENRPLEFVTSAVAMVLEVVGDPMTEDTLKEFVNKLIAQASDAKQIAEEAKALAQEKVLQKLEEEQAQLMSLKETEALLLLALME